MIRRNLLRALVSGFTYGLLRRQPRRQDVSHQRVSSSPHRACDRLLTRLELRLPLKHQPGTKFTPDVSTDSAGPPGRGRFGPDARRVLCRANLLQAARHGSTRGFTASRPTRSVAWPSTMGSAAADAGTAGDRRRSVRERASYLKSPACVPLRRRRPRFDGPRLLPLLPDDAQRGRASEGTRCCSKRRRWPR